MSTLARLDERSLSDKRWREAKQEEDRRFQDQVLIGLRDLGSRFPPLEAKAAHVSGEHSVQKQNRELAPQWAKFWGPLAIGILMVLLTAAGVLYTVLHTAG